MRLNDDDGQSQASHFLLDNQKDSSHSIATTTPRLAEATNARMLSSAIIRNSARINCCRRSRSRNFLVSSSSSSSSSWLLTSHRSPPGATSCSSNLRRRPLSTTSDSEPTASSPPPSTTTTATTSRYAVVDHSDAYEEAIQGRHGKQLELAKLEGLGKDDPPFNPFLQDDLEEDEDDEEQSKADNEDEEDDDEYEDDEEADDEQSPYNNDGSLRWKKSQLATFRAGAPAGGLFAIVELAGSQHKVTTDDLLGVNLLKPVEHYKVGSIHTLTDHQVMLVGSSHMTFVGMPFVKGAQVDVMVEEITQDAKVIVFKKRRRKNYKRKKGHRRDVTLLRILDIRPPKEFANHKHVQRENPE